MARVMMVGTTENSGGGVTTVMKLFKKMPVWEKYNCFWLGTQIQAGRWLKIKTLLSAYLSAIIHIWRFDIVHFHTVPGSGVRLQLPVFLLAKLLNKKCILHLHIGNQLEREAELHDRVFRWCMKKADLLILLSNRFKEMLDKNYPYVTTPRMVVYNSCEDVEPIPYCEHQKTILFAGAFTYNKAGDLLINAFAKVHGKYPDWKLQMLGSGPWESKYRDYVELDGLSDYVEFPGYLSGKSKIDFFRNAGIYAMCSYLEGFPMVVLEAWSYGVPVVTTPVGGMPDVIEEDKNACKFDFGNVDQLAEKLDYLMGNYDLRESMSEYCLAFVREKFSLDVINKQLDSIYSNLCQN